MKDLEHSNKKNDIDKSTKEIDWMCEQTQKEQRITTTDKLVSNPKYNIKLTLEW